MGFFNLFKKNSNSEQSSAEGATDMKYKNSWNCNLMEMLKNAKEGNRDGINELLKTYSPLAAVNEDFSVLLLFRYFQVQYWNEERSVLNCHPQDENFQCGITIVKAFEDGGGGQHNVYLPNNLKYKKLTIQDNEIEIITDDEKVVKTNATELSQKLWMKFTETDIENGYKNLCNEQYQKPEKPKVEDKVIHLPSCGELIYDEKFQWYEGTFTIDNKDIELIIHYETPKNFKNVLAFIDNQLKSKFYEKVLLEMEEKMVDLKNDNWLDEDEETGEEEQEITKEDFRKRISIENISFNNDCSSTIYCNDDDIFWGHSIEITVDENGNYTDSNLAG